MIQINLLPQEAQTQAAGRAPRQPGAGTGMLIVLLVIVFALGIPGAGAAFMLIHKASSDAALADARQELRDTQAEVKKLETEYAEIREGLEIARKQWRILQTLNAPDRLFWTEKLNILPLLVPEGIYLTGIYVDEDVTETETQESKDAFSAWVDGGRKGDAPERDFYPLIIQTLRLEGISYVPDGTSDERLDKIIQFIEALEGQSVEMPFSGEPVNFMDKFANNVEWNRFEDTRLDNRVVQEFSLTITSLPFGTGEE